TVRPSRISPSRPLPVTSLLKTHPDPSRSREHKERSSRAGPSLYRYDPDALHGRSAEGEFRASRHADGARAAGVRAVDAPPEAQSAGSAVGGPGPVHSVRGSR